MATSTQPTTPAVADRHDLIRVEGARENNLKDISVELPKRRLTVFTGVSGSGKSSLVFATIAAESQRMINETYSAFVQGFMPNLSRPDVDHLEGLTTAIIVDQERMGSNPRSTVGTATDANAMLRILFSRLGTPHVGDSHDLIRVHGARENNLKDIHVELPKRRLTAFTGVSGSGKSSLVFGTIAAESQRLINETYSAFVQGFMPTLGRPDVDVLEGLTTAIIVDQERMGANPRSTVGTATDANAMLRIVFSRLGQPYIGSPQA
ncbi:MAG TPA: hypothetical protein VNN23_03590, partial [Ornithinibacter sp.]|nr:hypothetical protein [Ornithinibacter sp.]